MMWTVLQLFVVVGLAVCLPAVDQELKVRGTRNARHCQVSHRTVNTTERLNSLRQQLADRQLDAYIVYSGDDHQSEYTAEHDLRREWISGFRGSNGDAVVTQTKAALWTDSRYYLAAEQQLDCNWELMKTGETGTPTIDEWLQQQLEKDNSVATDPKIIPYSRWATLEKDLGSKNITLKLVTENLIDEIWTESTGRPPYPNAPLIVHNVKYAGLSWQDKMSSLRKNMTLRDESVDAIVVHMLDQIAWVLNLRGGDVPFTPVFRSYLIIEKEHATLFIPPELDSDLVRKHLNSDQTEPGPSVHVKPYLEFWDNLKTVGEQNQRVAVMSSYSYDLGASHLIYSSIPRGKIVLEPSPILVAKGLKNEVEAKGMRNAHIKDAVALCQLMAQLEEEMAANSTKWDELEIAAVADAFRWKQDLSFGPSFQTISAVGAHAALPHYEPSIETNAPLNTSTVLLIDSGGQYLDGTTDVTRTMHYGIPDPFIIKVYTTLLIGCIDLASVTFKKGHAYRDFELLVRGPLYALGLNYGHGTTHGISMFLGVHEGFDDRYGVNFFGSQEPGYYKENDFGIRLENIVTVLPSNVSSAGEDEFLTFEIVTLIPYEKNLIDVTLMQPKHVEYLNKYHATVMDLVGSELLKQGLQKEFKWLQLKTKPLKMPGHK